MFLDAVYNYLLENDLKNVFQLHVVDIDEYIESLREEGKEIEEYSITIVENPDENGKGLYTVEFYIISNDPDIAREYSTKLKQLLGEDLRYKDKYPYYKWNFSMTDSEGTQYDIFCAKDKKQNPYLYDLNPYVFYYEVEFKLKK
jgi:hypothetical protein